MDLAPHFPILVDDGADAYVWVCEFVCLDDELMFVKVVMSIINQKDYVPRQDNLLQNDLVWIDTSQRSKCNNSR